MTLFVVSSELNTLTDMKLKGMSFVCSVEMISAFKIKKEMWEVTDSDKSMSYDRMGRREKKDRKSMDCKGLCNSSFHSSDGC